jgi:multiple sugar transport system substrate-binding protein
MRLLITSPYLSRPLIGVFAQMKRPLRISLAVGLALCVALSIAACGKDAPSGNGPVTLTFWSGMTGGDKAAYEAVVKRWNDTHPNIHVDYQLQPWDTIAQKLPTSLATGSGPDLATPDYNVATVLKYAKAGTIADLSSAYGSGDGKIDTNAIAPTLTQSFTVDGKQYAAPLNNSTLLLYVNKDLFAKAAVAIPTTMDQMRAAAVKLTDKTAGQYGLSLPDHESTPNWPILIWAEGGDIVGPDNCGRLSDPKTIAAMQTWGDLISRQGIAAVGKSGQDSDNLFAAGKSAMQINGPWAAGAYSKAGINFDVVPVPTGALGSPVTAAQTIPIVVSKKSKNLDAVYQFLAWWTGKEAQGLIAKGAGNPPVRTDMANDPVLNENPLTAKFAAAGAYAKLYLPTVSDFGRVDSDVLTPAIGKIERGEPAAQILADANKQLDTLLGCTT